MKILAFAACTSLVVSALIFPGVASAAPQTPAGEWRVADGQATIRIEKCGAFFCGYIATAVDAGKDIRNPDPSKRGRSVIGIEILFNMKADGSGGFAGETYNADDGQIYIATLTPSGTTMKIQGCVPNGGICGSEMWTLVKK